MCKRLTMVLTILMLVASVFGSAAAGQQQGTPPVRAMSDRNVEGGQAAGSIPV